MHVTIHSAGVEGKLLDAAIQTPGAARDALLLLGVHMIRSTTRNFQEEGRKDGAVKTWKPLAPSTIARRRRGSRRGRREGGGFSYAKPLQVTGRLKNSVSFTVSGLTLRVGTNVEYGQYHQEGGPNLSQREFLVYHDEDKSWFVVALKKLLARKYGVRGL